MKGLKTFSEKQLLRTLASVQCCFTCTETIRTRDGEPRTSTSTLTQIPSVFTWFRFCVALRPRRSYELLGTATRTATSTLTQFLSSVMRGFVSMLLYVRRDHKDDYGQGAQDGHLDFHR